MRLRVVPHLTEGCACRCVKVGGIIIVVDGSDKHRFDQPPAYSRIKRRPFGRRRPACIAWIAVSGAGARIARQRICRCRSRSQNRRHMKPRSAVGHDSVWVWVLGARGKGDTVSPTTEHCNPRFHDLKIQLERAFISIQLQHREITAHGSEPGGWIISHS